MTNRYKTQCPRCQTTYPMPDDKLNKPKARANCGKCGHTFFLNLHLVEPKDQVKPSSGGDVASNNHHNHTTNITNNATSSPKSAKKTKTPLADDMIFDDMDSKDDASDDISFDGLDDFLKQPIINNQPVVASSKLDTAQQNGSDDESWLDDLLKNDDSPNIKTQPQHNTQTTKENNDNITDLLGTDYVNVIPIATDTASQNPEILTQKIEARLSYGPSQEQLAKRQGVGAKFGWLVVCVAMLVLLGVQYVVFNADAIAKNPQKAELMGSLCSSLPCPKISANPNAFDITYTTQPSTADYATDLVATIKNTSTTEQLYPNLKITITSDSGVIGDLAIAPTEYLTAEHRLLAPEQNNRFMLTLDIDPQMITSIQIEPFY